MRAFLTRANRFLDEPLDLGPRLLMIVAAACLVVTFFLPLWNLTMFAPQYPNGLRLDIYDHALRGGNGGQDVKEINVLNHYIGMHDLAEEDFTEFKWMPFVVGGISLLILRAVVHGTVAALVDASVVFFYFGAFSLWSFGYKLYRYGHDLAPTAAVKVDPFMPPMFGYSKIANFEVYSYPQASTYVMGLALLLLAAALLMAWRTARHEGPRTVAA
jgi:copper chaperone NosL